MSYEDAMNALKKHRERKNERVAYETLFKEQGFKSEAMIKEKTDAAIRNARVKDTAWGMATGVFTGLGKVDSFLQKRYGKRR